MKFALILIALLIAFAHAVDVESLTMHEVAVEIDDVVCIAPSHGGRCVMAPKDLQAISSALYQAGDARSSKICTGEQVRIVCPDGKIDKALLVGATVAPTPRLITASNNAADARAKAKADAEIAAQKLMAAQAAQREASAARAAVKKFSSKK